MAKKASTLIQQSRRKSPAEKATYHQEAGAGRSRVKRRFFELGASDEAAIVARITQSLDRTVKET